MGMVVGDRLGWSINDPRRQFVTHTWAATLNFVNASVHPEGGPDSQEFGVHETRLVFEQVALLSEFLSAVSDGSITRR